MLYCQQPVWEDNDSDDDDESYAAPILNLTSVGKQFRSPQEAFDATVDKEDDSSDEENFGSNLNFHPHKGQWTPYPLAFTGYGNVQADVPPGCLQSQICLINRDVMISHNHMEANSDGDSDNHELGSENLEANAVQGTHFQAYNESVQFAQGHERQVDVAHGHLTSTMTGGHF